MKSQFPHLKRGIRPALALSLAASLLRGAALASPAAFAAPSAAPSGPAAAITDCTEAGLDAALALGGSLVFSCGGPATITLTSTKVISQNTTLDGANQVTLSGGGAVRLFQVTGNVDATLANLTLRDGYVFDPPFYLEYGGAVHNAGRLTVINTVFEDNHNPSGRGGAIFTDITGHYAPNGQSYPATLTISSSTFISNTSTDGAGGAIFASGTLTVTDTTFQGNAANNGGGVYIHDDGVDGSVAVSLSLSDSHFEDNHATFGGGGGLKYGGSKPWPLVVDNVAFVGNTATGFGGGAELTHNLDVPNTALVVRNSHFEGNTAEFTGGGLYAGPVTVEDSVFEANTVNVFNGGGAQVVGDSLVTRSTFRENTVQAGHHDSGGSALTVNTGPALISANTFAYNEMTGSDADGGTILFENLQHPAEAVNNTIVHNTTTTGASVIYTYDGGITLTHNTMAGNVNLPGCTGECYVLQTTYRNNPFQLDGNILDNPGAANCRVALDSLGHNLFSDIACGPVATDTYSQTAELAPLANYGGPTQTRLPYTGSPARDSAGTACPAADQRGVSRPVGPACDSGAVEADGELAPPIPPAPEPVLAAQSFPSHAGPASQSRFRTLALAGDPVNAIFGNFTYQHTDLALPGFGPSVAVRRTYNSALPQDGLLGYGWRLAYDLRVSAPTSATVTVTRGDGRVDTYTVSGDALIPPPGSADSLVENDGGGYTLATREHLTYTFNSAGRLLSAADPDGNTVTLTYTGDQWTGITDAAGRAWSLAYNGAGRLSSITDPAGRTVSFGYSPAGDLVSATNAAGGATTYAYDSDHRLTEITDANGHLYLAHVYDASGHVVQQTDARGTHTFAYADGYTLYTDPQGAVTRLSYAANYRLTSRVAAYGTTQAVTTSLAYTGAGLVASQTDGNGHATTYTYDARDNVFTETNALGHTSTATYDGADNRLTQTDALGATTTWTYSPSNHPLTQTDALGGVTTYAYDGRGLLATLTGALGHTTTYTYDAHGNLTRIEDPLGAETTFTYDAAGRLTTVTDPLGRTTAFTYSPLNLLLAETAPDGGVTTHTYDAVGNRLTTTDPLGHTTAYTYDAAGDLTAVTGPLGHATTYAYDGLGRLTGTTNPLGHTTTYTYDLLGRRVATTSPLGHATTYTYDAAGNLTALTDPAGAATTYTYDAAHRLVGATDALGGAAAYAYDAAGRLVSLTDPLGHATTYTYDALGRRLTQANALGHTTSAAYDALGRLTALTNGAGQTVTYTYDALGRLLAASGPGVNASFTYDAAGNRAKMTDALGMTTYTYDAANRPVSINSPQGLLTYTYDLAGRRTGLNQPGAALTYTYDAAGRLSALKLAGSPLAGYAYDAAGRLVQQTFGNGVQTALTYDADGRLAAQTTQQAGATLHNLTYTRDARGHVTAETAAGFDAAYTYDLLGRLTGAVLNYTPDGPTQTGDYQLYLPAIQRGGGAASDVNAGATGTAGQTFTYAFTYDAAGNRLSASLDDTVQSFAYDAANRLAGAGYAYDAAGRLTAGGAATYTYDALGRLTSAGDVQFAYDGDGRRVGQTAAGVTTTFLLDTALALPTRLAATGGGQTERWHFGLGLAAVRPPGGALQYAQADGLGSLRLLTSDAGDMLATPVYGPFGACLQACAGLGFAGEPLDGSLVHLRARDYSPGLGRFLTPDPLGPALGRTQGLNTYAYVENNPVNHADPSGLCWLGPLCGAANFVAHSAQAVGQAVAGAAASVGAAVQRLVGRTPPTLESARAGSAGLLNRAGGGNAIAAGGGNVIAAGGGNVIAAGGGNVIAAGGGNVIAAGGGNVINWAPSRILSDNGLGIISDNGLGLISDKGAGLISDKGAGLISDKGAGLIGVAGGN